MSAVAAPRVRPLLDQATATYLAYEKTWGLLVALPVLQSFTGKPNGKVCDVPDDLMVAFIEKLNREPQKVLAIGIKHSHSL